MSVITTETHIVPSKYCIELNASNRAYWDVNGGSGCVFLQGNGSNRAYKIGRDEICKSCDGTLRPTERNNGKK